MWLSDDPTDRAIAVGLCNGCEVIKACDDLARAMPARFGVSAGHDHTARARKPVCSEQDLVDHVIGRDQAKQLGWSDDKINSRANTQPEHVRCSVSSGGKHVREQAAAAPGYGGHSSVGLPLVLDMPLCTLAIALLIFDRKSWRTAPESAIDRVSGRAE